MPPSKKKNAFSYSINPDLWQRSHQPTSTIAMGMKSSQASSLCWKDQVKKENALTASWRAIYDPEGTQEGERSAALQRTLARDAQRHAEYHDRARNPEMHAILKANGDLPQPPSPSSSSLASSALEGDKAPSDTIGSRCGANPCDSGMAHTAFDEKKKKSVTFALPSSFSAAAAGRPQNVMLFAASSGSGEGSAAAAALSDEGTIGNGYTFGQDHKKPSERYLTARTAKYTVQQRYPSGPMTSSQVVGWRVESAALAGGETFKKKPNAVLAGPYRTPEDDDHALLFGYDLQAK